ncbi:MAG: flagellar M-ring protein FliF C-terminal domain-containing protein [Phycisphaerales bacterium JB039]
MDQLRRILATIRTGLGRLGPTERMLIGSLCVILVMALFLVSQYAGRPKLVSLFPGVALSDVQREDYMAVLASYPVKPGPAGEILVPAEQATALRGKLAESGRAPADTSLMFETLVEKQSWTSSREENHRNLLIAKGNEIAAWIRAFDGVSTAGVIVTEPPPSGLGRAATSPTASVTVRTTGGQQLSQKNIDAIASLVAGAVPRLDPQDVSIAVNGIPRSATDPDELIPGTALEYRQTVERTKERKVLSLLSYIPGLEVWVTVDANVAREFIRSVQFSRPVTAPVTELRTETQQSQASRGAEPGARPNTQLSINRGSGGGTQLTETTEETTFESRFGERLEEKTDPGGAVKRLAASISVPKDWIRQLLVDEQPAPAEGAEAPAPTEQEIQARYEQEKARIVDLVRPHLLPDGAAPTEIDTVLVQVAMVPRKLDLMGAAGDGAGGQASLIPGLEMGPMVDKILLGGLAVVSLGLMAMMVRKAGRRAALPTAEELAGVPQTLHSESDLIGEADESEAAMAGIEVDDAQIHTQRMLEQVTRLVGEKPESVASLVATWLAQDE